MAVLPVDAMNAKDAGLSHVDSEGKARMVDVGEKPISRRRAVAEGLVRGSDDLLDAIEQNTVAKGDLLDVARIAGIQAAKRTAELIPLCHPLPIDHIDVEAWVEHPYVRIRASAQTTARTGIEMEALTAVAGAALTVIDMGKAIDPAMVVQEIRLIEKTGGTSGDVPAPE